MKRLLTILILLVCATTCRAQLSLSTSLNGVIQAPIDANGWRDYKVTVSQNVTSFSFIIIPPAQPPAQAVLTVEFTENATGGFTVAFAAGISSPCTVATAANATTVCQFIYDGPTGTFIGYGGAGTGGIVSGTGATNQVTLWTGTNTIGGNTGLTYVPTTLTVGVAGGGNGVLGLAGTTSGSATFTASPVAGTSTNPVTASNILLGPPGTAVAPTFSVLSGVGIFDSVGSSLGFSMGGTELARLNTRTAGGAFGVGGSVYFGGFPGAGVTSISTTPGISLNGVAGSMLLLGIDSGTLGEAIDAAGDIGMGGSLSSMGFNMGDGASPGSHKTLISGTPPTIAGAGCGGSAASIVANTISSTAAFDINVGTAPTTACTITLPAAARVWNCYATDVTTNSTTVFLQKQTGTRNTTSVTLTNFSDVAVASNFTANDILSVSCFAQ